MMDANTGMANDGGKCQPASDRTSNAATITMLKISQRNLLSLRSNECLVFIRNPNDSIHYGEDQGRNLSRETNDIISECF